MFKAAADLSADLSEPAYSLQLDLQWGSGFASRLRTRVFRVLFCFVNWIFSGSWSRHRVIFSKLISEPACSSQMDLHWASPQRICGPFLEFIHVFRFCQPACFFDLHWDSPKLPWGMQRICGPFVLKTIIMPFKRSFDLWHSLIRSLYFIWVFIFIPLIHSSPFLRFSHILLHTNFFLCILPRKIFFLSLMTLLLGT